MSEDRLAAGTIFVVLVDVKVEAPDCVFKRNKSAIIG